MLDEANARFVQKSFTFWNKLDDRERNLLLENAALIHYTKGEIIHSADNECVGVLLIKSGELRAYILSKDGREVTLYRLASGAVCILSASCLMNNITFDVHIGVEIDSEVVLINASTFSLLQSANVYVDNFALRVAADRFSDVMWVMEQILFMKLDRRLATFLWDELSKSTSDDVKLTHEQIAKYISSAREAVSRMLKQLESDGIVGLYRGGVRILDRAKLKKLL